MNTFTHFILKCKKVQNGKNMYNVNLSYFLNFSSQFFLFLSFLFLSFLFLSFFSLTIIDWPEKKLSNNKKRKTKRKIGYKIRWLWNRLIILK
jgi:hypothetical protein